MNEVKSANWIEGRSISATQRTTALITIRKRPRVSQTSGVLTKRRIGFTKMLRSVMTRAALITDRIPPVIVNE